MIPAASRRWIEALSLLVAAFCILVAVIARLVSTHVLGKPENLLLLSIAAMLVALWTVADGFRAGKVN